MSDPLRQAESVLWTVAHQDPLSVGFSRQEYWSGFPFLPSGDLPHPGIKSVSPICPTLQVDSLSLSHWGSPHLMHWWKRILFFFFFGSKFLKFIILWEMGSSGPVKTPGFRYNSLRGTASRKEAGFLFMRDRPIVI